MLIENLLNISKLKLLKMASPCNVIQSCSQYLIHSFFKFQRLFSYDFLIMSYSSKDKLEGASLLI